ncbi:ATP-binding protein [Pseudoduganella danionis]|jgi:two-component system sensor histidine kinase AdeS|uniref:ATP-binding protein n=1 Tax=Pseudoduganella danionis TaxID=1890295 RepID=UPI0035AEC013
MKLNAGISRQISLSMALVVLGIIAMVQISSYALYFWLMRQSPDALCDITNPWPEKEEVIWLIATTICSLLIAVLAAGRLSRRILTPLNSVAQSLRAVAQGDLSARAGSDQHAMGEAAQLVSDFNLMAERQQHMAQQRAFWNAAIAHELRTPVTILRGRLQGINDGVFAAEPAQFQSLLKQVEGLGHLIEDLRTVALAESGHLPLQKITTQLDEEVASVVELAEPLWQAGGFRIEVALNVAVVECDPIRIRQALLAMLENACKHATPGLIRISAEISQGYCHLAVADQGPGIAPAAAQTIFEAFQRGAAVSAGKTSGSGLGLAVVKAIALAHGGFAFCHPSSLGGSQFEICWPINASG